MFRSRLSALLMSLAVLAGVVALTSWVSTTTVLNPDRVTHAAGSLLQSSAGREALTRQLTDRVVDAAPESDRAAVESASRQVAADPRISGALERLAGADTPSERDAAAGALLDGLDQVSPQASERARGRLQAAGGVDQLVRDRTGAEVPGSRQDRSVLGPFATFAPESVSAKLDGARAAALVAQRAAAVAAILLAACALVLGPRRDRLLRQVGRAGLVIGGLALLAWIVVSAWLLPQWDSVWAQVAAETLQSGGGSLAVVFGMILVGGLACLVLGFALRQLRPTHQDEVGEWRDHGAQPRRRSRLGYRGEFPDA